MNYPFNFDEIKGFDEKHSFAGFYEKCVAEAPAGSTLVEVGCFHGRSLVQLGMCAKMANKGLKVFGVDHCDEISKGLGPEILENIKKAGVEDVVTFIPLASLEGSKKFADNSCWMVFLDDDHRHEAVAAGVDAWMPKVADGGILAFHDARWHTVAQPIHAKLSNVIHDPAWDDCLFCSKQKPKPTGEVDIYLHFDPPTWYATSDCFRNDGLPSLSPLTARVSPII